ncbi:MAG TPA: lysylphosphatidylglycerol synthase domain-containing protein [Verrucomicrobiae bacterium]|nr:lysylphosphatidylglycerol synthase domain-containing protein [Verrucomicrobiae bacterium]
MKKLHSLLLALGLVFLGYLVWKIGPARLGNEFVKLGWGLALFVAFEFLAEGLHTKGWSYCLSGAYRRTTWFQLFRIRMAGNAINYLTPTAALGGEVTKAALLSANHKGPEAISGVLVGRLSSGIAHALFVACGSIVVMFGASLPRSVWAAMFASAGIVMTGIVVFLMLQKYGKLGVFIRWLAARAIAGRLLKKIAGEISHVDEALKAFYREQPGDLARAVSWQLLGHSTGLLQTWWFLTLLHHPFSAETIATVWVLGMWFDLLTFAVPLNMGTLEGSRVVAFKAAGMGALAGMTYGLALRLAQLSVAGFGLISYAYMMKTASQKVPSHPRETRPHDDRGRSPITAPLRGPRD